MFLSVIVPAYNEEKNLAANIKKFNSYLARQPYDYEIIIVNDGSTDQTAAIAGRLARKIKNLRLINNKRNQGKGASVCRGLLAASGRYRLFLDADGATAIDHLNKVWPHFQQGCEIVIGSRNPRDARGALQAVRQPFWKRVLGTAGNRLFQFLIIRGIWDTQCGFKIFTRKAANTIIPKITNKRWLFDVEILVVARALGYKTGKIPVRWHNVSGSRVGLRGYFSALREMIKIKYNLIKAKYE